MARRLASISCAIAGLASLLGSVAHAEPEPEREPRLAIVDGVRINVSEEASRELADDLAGAVRDSVQVRALPSDEVWEALQAEDVPSDCASRRRCLARLADTLEVDQLLFLVVVEVGDALRIEPTWLDAHTGERVELVPLLVGRLEDRSHRFAVEVPRLLPRAKPRAKPRAEVAPPMPPPEEPPSQRGSPGERQRTAGLILGGIGVAAAAGAVYFAYRADAHATYLENAFADGGTWNETAAKRERSFRRDRKIAITSGIIGGLALATGATLWWLGRSGSQAAGADELALGAGPSDGGALLFGRCSF